MGIAGHSSLRGHASMGMALVACGRRGQGGDRASAPNRRVFNAPILTSSFTAAHPGQTGYRPAA
ncbi:hypothetical protein CFB43_24865 [Burkholderia sp. AU15512]|nr:hypothetical protein CFB43_24865 [Burkholderia sp. AU15512]